MKNVILVFVSILATAIIMDYSFGRIRTENYSAVNTRWPQPFLGFGDFKELNSASESLESLGYRALEFGYIYDDEKVIHYLHERGNFLFSDEHVDPKKKNIFLVGASAALGDGASDHQNSIWRNLENLLYQKTSDYQVLPAAIRAYNSTQERIATELYLFPIKPNRLIFFHGFNDANQVESLARPGDPYNQGLVYFENSNLLFSFLKLFSEQSNIINSVFKNYIENSISKRSSELLSRTEFYSGYVQSAAHIYMDNIGRVNRRCQQEGIPCYFILQPYRRDTAGTVIEDIYSKINQLVENQNQLKKGINFFDYSDKYANKKSLFFDVVHLNDEGQREVAQDIYSDILQK